MKLNLSSRAKHVIAHDAAVFALTFAAQLGLTPGSLTRDTLIAALVAAGRSLIGAALAHVQADPLPNASPTDSSKTVF